MNRILPPFTLVLLYFTTVPMRADAPPPAIQPLWNEFGIGTQSSFFDFSMPYHWTFPRDGFGRFSLEASAPERPPTTNGTVGVHGWINTGCHAFVGEDGDFLFVNFRNASKFQGVTGSTSNGIADPFSRSDDIPFNITFFTTNEPLDYGLEIEAPPGQQVITGDNTDFSSFISPFTALVSDPTQSELQFRRANFGYRRHTVIYNPLRYPTEPDERVIYRNANQNAQGAANGTIPAGNYALSTGVWYQVGSSTPGAAGIETSMEAWAVVGRVAAWKKSESGNYGEPSRWALQHQPAAGYHVLFLRPNAIYTVAGIAGSAKRFLFSGGSQEVTFSDGTASASQNIRVTNFDTLRLRNTTITAPLVTVDLGATLELKNNSNLHADPESTGQILIATDGSAACITVAEESHARGSILVMGTPGGGGGGFGGETSAASVAELEAPPLALAEGRGAVISGTVHLGANAYASGAELAIRNQLDVLSGAQLDSFNGVVDRNAPGTMKIERGKWTNSDTVSVGVEREGSMDVSAGGRVETETLKVAVGASANATVNVSAGGSLSALHALVGFGGIGRLNVDSSTLNLSNFTVGANAGAVGFATVSATPVTTEGIIVGNSGRGTLEFSNGCNITTTSIEIGLEPDAQGTLTVDGSSLALAGTAKVGTGGQGRLDIRNNSTLTGNGTVKVGAAGILTLSNGSVATDSGFTALNGGDVIISGGSRFIGASGLIAAPGSSVLLNHATDCVFNVGFDVSTKDFQVIGGSTVLIENGNISPSGILTLGGVGTRLVVEDTLNVNGEVRIGDGARVEGMEGSSLGLGPNSRITGSAGSLRFPNVINSFGIVLPGASPGKLTFEGAYTQGPGGVIDLEIGGTLAGTEHDQFHVTGDSSIDGLIVLRFINGFLPAPGQQFDLIVCDGSFSGTPAIVVEGLAPGWQYGAAFDPITRTFRVTSQSSGLPTTLDPGGVEGDPDRDGMSNFLERSLGTDIGATSLDGLPTTEIITDPSDGKRYLTFTYRRALAASDRIFQIESAENPRTWMPEINMEPLNTPVLSPDGRVLTTTMRLLPALEDDSRPIRLLRLRISL